MTGRDSMIRFGRLPMCRGWISRLFPLRTDSWTKKGSGEYKILQEEPTENVTYGFTMEVK